MRVTQPLLDAIYYALGEEQKLPRLPPFLPASFTRSKQTQYFLVRWRSFTINVVMGLVVEI